MDKHSSLIEQLKAAENIDAFPSVWSFLKKIILLYHQGRLQINGQAPDKAVLLGEYLVDGQRLIIDWSRLSEFYKRKLQQWLILSHQHLFRTKWFAPYRITEARGRVEEQPLSWLQQLTHCALFSHQYYTLPWPEVVVRPAYQLSRIDLCLSTNGMLIDLTEQGTYLVPPIDKAIGARPGEHNVKRLILTDDIIANVLEANLNELEIITPLQKPHPHAVTVFSKSLREKRMRVYRENNQYLSKPPFWWRIWLVFRNWILGLVHPPQVTHYARTDIKLCQTQDIRVTYCKETHEVAVMQPRPAIDTFVFSGGGARIFGHLGAVEELKKAGIEAKVFAGSSAGAIMACFLYLGHEIEEIKSSFDWVRDQLLLDYRVDFSGLSTTDRFKTALRYFISSKVINEIAKHQQWFQSEEAQAFLEAHVNNHAITFETIAKLKARCPELPFGEKLIVTATNSTLRRTEIFSLDTTPRMEIAEAIKISASLPVVYKPTIRGGHRYTDGGILNNLPLTHFIDENAQFIEHEHGASYRVLAFQFDTGVEADVLYTNKPVFRENWLMNTLYAWLTGVRDPARGWQRDRRLLRKYALQSIVIDVNNIKAAKFDINHLTRDALIEQGRKAARSYLATRVSGKKTQGQPLAELLFYQFENMETFLVHCALKKRWHLLEQAMDALTQQALISEQMLEYLITVKDGLLAAKTQQNEHKPLSIQWRKLLPFVLGVECLKKGTIKKTKANKAILFCILFPVLSQPWGRLVNEENKQLIANQIDQLEKQRKRLTPTSQVIIFSSLVEFMEAQTGPSHLFFYILKTLLLYARDEGDAELIQQDTLKFTVIFNHMSRLKLPSMTHLIGNWQFDMTGCRAILQCLCDQDEAAFIQWVGVSYLPPEPTISVDQMPSLTTYPSFF